MKTRHTVVLSIFFLSVFCLPMHQTLAHPLENWTIRSSGVTNDLTGITYGAGLFVAVGTDGILLRSTDGQLWEHQPLSAGQEFNRVRFLSDQFIALGRGIIARSTDGQSWTILQTAETDWYDIVYDGKQYLLIGYEQLAFTKNFAAFTALGIPDPEAYTGLFTGQHYLFGGDKGDVQFSTDGLGWSPALQTGCYIGRVAQFAGMYFAVGCQSSPTFSSAGYQSSSGTAWEGIPSLATPDIIFSDLAAGGGYLVAVGSNGAIRATEDGEKWNDYSAGNKPALPGNSTWANQIAYGAGSFVVVGDKGQLWQSPLVVPQLRIAKGPSGLILSWPLDFPDFTVEETSCLAVPVAWSAITERSAVTTSEITVTVPASAAQRFFRLRKP
jgi:photosystem II stability/assembly factor-like uncharacterized protein